MRTIEHFEAGPDFRARLSGYAARYEEFALLDSCGNEVYGPNQFDQLLACSAVAVLPGGGSGSGDADWKTSVNEHADWIFGYLGYECNAGNEPVFPSPNRLFDTPPYRFFVPGIVIMVKQNTVTISVHASVCDSPERIFHDITETPIYPQIIAHTRLEPLVTASEYINAVKKIQQHIIDGDIYELNFCQPFAARDVDIDPISIFNRLCEIAKAPFSVLYRFNDQYLICASPERFFSFDGKVMKSMPIKGTAKRGGDSETDKRLKDELANSEKDRAEHVMIVDLVRNDLTPYAIPGSIQVDDLFGIYGFEQVWQMVSTIVATKHPDASLADALIHAFPMGSMTGAPKIRAMQLAAAYEPWQRGMYSGAFGYITPEGHCDFNVIIRSLLYNNANRLLAAYAGGAIVFDSEPQHELEECYLKLSAIQRVLGGD